MLRLYRWNILFLLIIAILSIFYFREVNMYKVLINRSIQSQMSEREKITSLLKVVRKGKPAYTGVQSTFREEWFPSGDSRLQSTDSRCGNMASIFAEASQLAGFKARILQITQNDRAMHVMAEVMIDGKWALVDPSFSKIFTLSDGSLVNFEEFSKHYAEFRDQIPSEYLHWQLSFDKEHVRYTNWGKISFISQSIRQALVFFLGEEKVEKISIRVFLLNIYRVLIVLVMLIWSSFNIYYFIKRKKERAPSF